MELEEEERVNTEIVERDIQVLRVRDIDDDLGKFAQILNALLLVVGTKSTW